MEDEFVILGFCADFVVTFSFTHRTVFRFYFSLNGATGITAYYPANQAVLEYFDVL